MESAARTYRSRTPELGEAFVHDLERAISKIAEAPTRWPVCREDARARRLVLERFPFTVVYRVQRDAPIVIAVAHNRRRPGFWRDRLRAPPP
ncbi:MAG: type II toxin-antitoxin system RelE/ParE family toxin [Myxococcales bacterium]|nr:type II toxin-antitoxin system RelE/ParE family toxin [Myxococcales bacterium]